MPQASFITSVSEPIPKPCHRERSSCLTSDQDGQIPVCARRPRRPAVGTKEALRSGRTTEERSEDAHASRCGGGKWTGCLAVAIPGVPTHADCACGTGQRISGLWSYPNSKGDKLCPSLDQPVSSGQQLFLWPCQLQQ